MTHLHTEKHESIISQWVDDRAFANIRRPRITQQHTQMCCPAWLFCGKKFDTPVLPPFHAAFTRTYIKPIACQYCRDGLHQKPQQQTKQIMHSLVSHQVLPDFTDAVLFSKHLQLHVNMDPVSRNGILLEFLVC